MQIFRVQCDARNVISNSLQFDLGYLIAQSLINELFFGNAGLSGLVARVLALSFLSLLVIESKYFTSKLHQNRTVIRGAISLKMLFA